MSFRAWLSIITFVLIGITLYVARDDLLHAWQLLGSVNLWILALLIPAQILVYYAGGEMIFSYLRDKGKMKEVSNGELVQVALEGNFVNHVLPSGGVSGVSYLTWRLGQLGVPAGRATMAQVVRHAMGFVAYMSLLLIAIVVVTIDGDINRWIILTSAVLIGMMSTTIVAAIYLLASKRRVDRFSEWLTKKVNRITRRVTFGRRRVLLNKKKAQVFFDDMHHDFLELRHDKKLLIKPYIWGLVYMVVDAGLFVITFFALGEVVNPAPILIAYGVASTAGFFVLTPGGAGAYEAIMVAFLAVAGIASGVAITGIVLTRVIVLIGTIGCGYFFYQRSILKYNRK
ncbi:MAG: lysylphosphatidylglycerol synthase transmembrane domain-containing protein [Candidatus Saccharimonadales bacterium]